MPRDVVLCVDDEPIVLRMCSVAVAEAGFRAAVAENSAAGLETFLRLRDQICLVLADVVMPGKLNGVEMTAQMLRTNPELKILMMSGYSDEIIALEGYSHLPLIRKPFLPADLVQKIRSVLGIAGAASAT